ncbi:MAG TPA: ROK family protein, partial [Deltaproteobacteria bacterium]|nr:ROK family protein [Deltaproteobacteria bacterium]
AVATAAGPEPIEAVGVGVPGFVRGRTVLASPNFPTWREVPLAALLEERLGAPVSILNDANAAALGAWGQHGGGEDLVLLTLGTGVGGGVISEGRLLTGRAGTGAELGHIYVGGPRPCACGGVGCLEAWCSTTGLIRGAAELGHEVSDGAEVIAAASEGQRWASELLDEAGRRLGIGLVTLINVFAPRIVAIAGGLSQASGVLAPPAEAWLRRHGIAANVDHVSIAWLGPADELAIEGAARAAGAR